MAQPRKYGDSGLDKTESRMTASGEGRHWGMTALAKDGIGEGQHWGRTALGRTALAKVGIGISGYPRGFCESREGR